MVTLNHYFPEKKRKQGDEITYIGKGTYESWAGSTYKVKILALVRNSKGNSVALQGEEQLPDYGKKDELQSLIYLSCSCTLCPQFNDFT